MAVPDTTAPDRADDDHEDRSKKAVQALDVVEQNAEDVNDGKTSALREKQREMIQSLDLSKCVDHIISSPLLIAHQDEHFLIGLQSTIVTWTGRPRNRKSLI